MIVNGKKADFIKIQMIWLIFKLAWKYFKGPIKALKFTAQIIALRSEVYGNKQIIKFATNGNLYFHTSDIPGWPSIAYNEYIIGEFKRLTTPEIAKRPMQTAIVSITSDCPLACKHCYESEYIGTGIQLPFQKLEEIIAMLYQNGVRHLQLSGGEPLSRFVDLIKLLESSNKVIEFWLLTSGFGLSKEKALLLKKSGLTGVHISLDHFEADLHNQFRGNDHSYQYAVEATKNCLEVGIMVSLSLTATPKFVCYNFLDSYFRLAKELRVDFVRILESRSVGRFANKEVKLSVQQNAIIEDFYIKSINHTN